MVWSQFGRIKNSLTFTWSWSPCVSPSNKDLCYFVKVLLCFFEPQKSLHVTGDYCQWKESSTISPVPDEFFESFQHWGVLYFSTDAIVDETVSASWSNFVCIKSLHSWSFSVRTLTKQVNKEVYVTHLPGVRQITTQHPVAVQDLIWT